MESLKKELEKYEDKVINSYEYWFASFILDDISEIGAFETLIDEQYEFLFNVELSEKLQQIIVNNLNDFDTRELLIDFIKLKTITDKRILENKAYDETFVKEYVFEEKDDDRINRKQKGDDMIIKLNPKLKNREVIIKELQKFLFDYGFIEDELSKFKRHFEESNIGKILWKKENDVLIECILLMNSKQILNPVMKDKNRPFVPIILGHFKDKKGNDFQKMSISSSLSQKEKKGYSSFSKELKVFFDSLEIEFN